MLACPARKLEVMPYAFAARVEDAGLCVCDLQVSSRSMVLPFFNEFCRRNPYGLATYPSSSLVGGTGL